MRIIGPQPISGKVGTSAIADDAITEAKVANDAISITEMKAGTDGNIISYDASGDPVAIATGTDGQVLTSTGAGSPPAFETLSVASGLTKIATITTTGTDWAFTGLDTTYDTLLIAYRAIPATDNANLYLYVGTGAGPSYASSGYEWATYHMDNDISNMTSSNSDSQFKLHSDRGQGNDAVAGSSGVIWAHEPSSGTWHSQFHWNGFVRDTSSTPNGFATAGGGVYLGATTALTAFKLQYSSGNITGEATLYGLARG